MQKERDDFSVHLTFTSILTSLFIPWRGKGRPAEVVLVTPRREVRGLQYYLVLRSGLIPGRKIQDMFIYPLKEIQMIKLGKSVMAALVMSALIAGLFCCQKKEGRAERAGKQIDKAVEKAGQQIEKAGEKIQDAVEDAKKK